MTGFNGINQTTREYWNRTQTADPAILAHWKAGLDTLDIARELCIPEAAVFNRLLHAREADRREAEWNFDRIVPSPERVGAAL